MRGSLNVMEQSGAETKDKLIGMYARAHTLINTWKENLKSLLSFDGGYTRYTSIMLTIIIFIDYSFNTGNFCLRYKKIK